MLVLLIWHRFISPPWPIWWKHLHWIDEKWLETSRTDTISAVSWWYGHARREIWTARTAFNCSPPEELDMFRLTWRWILSWLSCGYSPHYLKAFCAREYTVRQTDVAATYRTVVTLLGRCGCSFSMISSIGPIAHMSIDCFCVTGALWGSLWSQFASYWAYAWNRLRCHDNHYC